MKSLVVAIPADVQAGEGAKVKLDFVADHDAIFERSSKNKDS